MAALNLPSVARIPAFTSINGGVMKDILHVAAADVEYLLKAISIQEIEKQEKIGNKPTNIIVDGKHSKYITDVKKSVVVYFASPELLAKAAFEVFLQLQMKGRRVTGKTLNAARYYLGLGKSAQLQPIGTPGPTTIKASDAAKADYYVTILQPHIRKWQWLTKTGARGTRRSRNKKFKAPRPLVSKSVYEVVAAAAQRKYKMLRIVPVYLEVPNQNPGGFTPVDRVPAVKIYMRTKGRILTPRG